MARTMIQNPRNPITAGKPQAATPTSDCRLPIHRSVSLPRVRDMKLSCVNTATMTSTVPARRGEDNEANKACHGLAADFLLVVVRWATGNRLQA